MSNRDSPITRHEKRKTNFMRFLTFSLRSSNPKQRMESCILFTLFILMVRAVVKNFQFYITCLIIEFMIMVTIYEAMNTWNMWKSRMLIKWRYFNGNFKTLLKACQTEIVFLIRRIIIVCQSEKMFNVVTWLFDKLTL